MNCINNIGVVSTTNLAVAGGYPRVVIDFISALNKLGKKVYLMTPVKLDLKKINELHGKIDIERVYCPQGWRKAFCKEDSLIRKSMKKQFKEMASQVDFIIDIDGRVNHRYLPKNFNKDNYIVWRVSGGVKIKMIINTFSKHVTDLIRILLASNKKDWPTKDMRVYAIDGTTQKGIVEGWKIPLEKVKILYPEIKTTELNYHGEKKKNQMVIFGRISPEKHIDESIKIFHEGTLKNKEYNLIIMGGKSPESDRYIQELNKLINKLNLTERVKIIPNAEFNLVRKTLKESKILIDCQKNVNLTMTAIEGMAAGCIILAHKTGGTYKEILNKGEYGFGFSSINEGVMELKKIIQGIKNKKIQIKKSIKRTEYFSAKKFKERLIKILKKEM